MAIYTIPPSAPFFDTVAEFLLADQSDALYLARTTIFLPTRRACQGLERVLLEKSGKQAIILPKIIPVRDVAEEIGVIIEESAEVAHLPVNAITPLQRLFIFSRMVLEWKTSIVNDLKSIEKPKWYNEFDPLFARISHAECVALAQDLARTLDQMTLEEIPPTALKDAVPQEFFSSSELNLAFLNIIMQVWPEYLAEHGYIDPIQAWDAAIRDVAAKVRAGQFGRVIAAGSTGSTPATAELLLAVASSENGTLILPGLDAHMSDRAWQQVGAQGQAETHPQLHLKRLLNALKIAHPRTVPVLGVATQRDPIISHALQPADTTDEWPQWRAQQDETALQAAMKNIALIEAIHEEEEALTIAHLLKEIACDAHKTAALITPNRALSRRVSSHLKRWGIEVPDSGGIPLAETHLGRVVRLLLNALSKPDDPHAALALMGHHLIKCTSLNHVVHNNSPTIGEHNVSINVLERGLFRGAIFTRPVQEWPQQLADYYAAFLDHDLRSPHAQKTLTSQDWEAAQHVLNAYIEAISPWLVLRNHANEPLPISEYIAAFQRVLNTLVGAPKSAREATIYGIIQNFLITAQEAQASAFKIPLHAFPAVFEVLLNSAPPVPPEHQNGRILLIGTIEARLLNFDRVILSGLNEGVWPPASNSDAWLGRSIRSSLHMPMPERRIALSAHDFAQFMGQGEVFITRALREGGTPTLPSRFVQRLSAVLGEAMFDDVRQRGTMALNAARRFYATPKRQPIVEPLPAPALHLKPRKLSVTRIETLIQNPYAIYAQYILKLKPFEQVQEPPDARIRGSLMHTLFEILAKNWVDDPARASAQLQAEIEARTADFPEKEKLFWRTQFLLAVPHMVAFEQERRLKARQVSVEHTGEMVLDLGNEHFTIDGRADRLEISDDGLCVIDFKTGQIPSKKLVEAGFYPQLPLLAVIAQRGGFGEMFTHIPLSTAEYVHVKTRIEPLKGQVHFGIGAAFETHVHATMSGLEGLLKHVLSEGYQFQFKPYRAVLGPREKSKDYDHLARIGEWGVVTDEEGEDE